MTIVYLPSEQSDADTVRTAVEAEGRRALLIPGDVSDRAFCDLAVERCVEHFGKLDILVNNAAYQESRDRLEDISDEDLEITFRTNIFG